MGGGGAQARTHKHTHARTHTPAAPQNRFVGTVDLIRPDRFLVREGYLVKLCRKKAKRFYFHLFNQELVYSKDAPGGRLILRHCLLLSKLSVEAVPDGSDEGGFVVKHAFRIRAAQKSFVAIAGSEEERQEWLSDLKHCITMCTGTGERRRPARAVSPAAHARARAARWVGRCRGRVHARAGVAAGSGVVRLRAVLCAVHAAEPTAPLQVLRRGGVQLVQQGPARAGPHPPHQEAAGVRVSPRVCVCVRACARALTLWRAQHMRREGGGQPGHVRHRGHPGCAAGHDE